jgi:hypothetical protein
MSCNATYVSDRVDPEDMGGSVDGANRDQI